jgi:4'-phosphopantetheinyl transferase
MNSRPCPPFLADRHSACSPTRFRPGSSLPRPALLSLGKEDVHVWFAFMDDMVPSFRSFLATLAADEISKTGRFHFQKDRDRYVLTRGLLREILSRYRGSRPGELQFCYSAHGKPALIAERGDERLSFNLSHANAAVVYAVTRGREVGVDLEYVSGDIDDRELAERCFSPREASALRLLPSGLRQKAFMTCWTRKEAYIKASGEGLSLNLESFDVLAQGDPAPRLHIESDPREAARWSLADLEAPAGYVAALAIEGNAHRVRYRQWEMR